jgi:hypothetical protein
MSTITDALNSDIAEGGGIAVTSTLLAANIAEWIGLFHLNDIIEFIMAIGGAVFIYWKIVNAKLEAKSKQLDNQLKEKQLLDPDNIRGADEEL